MSKKIKLENVIAINLEHKHDGIDFSNNKFCSKCGEKTEGQAIKEEYVCQSCRHLIQPTDKFCQNCGEALTDSNIIEHHISGSQLDDDLFQVIKEKIKK